MSGEWKYDFYSYLIMVAKPKKYQSNLDVQNFAHCNLLSSPSTTRAELVWLFNHYVTRLCNYGCKYSITEEEGFQLYVESCCRSPN